MNILITNQWGALAITCERHFEDRRKCFAGEVHTQPIAEDQTAIKDNYMGDYGCYRCRQEAQDAALPDAVRLALLSPHFSHTRYRNWCGAHIVYIYHRNPTSPSGVLLATSIDEARFNVIYNALRDAGLIHTSASPLSPTEGL